MEVKAKTPTKWKKNGSKEAGRKGKSGTWEDQKTGLTLTVKPQAGLEDPGLQRYLEASKLLYLVALGSLAFPNSVALLAKETTAIASQGLQSWVHWGLHGKCWRRVLKMLNKWKKGKHETLFLSNIQSRHQEKAFSGVEPQLFVHRAKASAKNSWNTWTSPLFWTSSTGLHRDIATIWKLVFCI